MVRGYVMAFEPDSTPVDPASYRRVSELVVRARRSERWGLGVAIFWSQANSQPDASGRHKIDRLTESSEVLCHDKTLRSIWLVIRNGGLGVR